MKKNLFLSSLMLLFVIIGFSSCKKKGQEPNPSGVTLTIETTTLSLKVGEQGAIKYTVTPKDTSVTFSSDKPAVATVSASGVVNGVSEGTAVISVQAGSVSKTVAVTVTADTPVLPAGNEVALIKKQEEEHDPEIEAHEAKIGRTLTSIPGANFPVYYNEKLTTIPLVGYGLWMNYGPSIILMLGRETVANCPNTRRMLEEVGFVNFREITVDTESGEGTGLMADYSKAEGVSVLMYDFDGLSKDFPGTTMWIQVEFPKTAEKLHETLNVKDFPLIQGVKTQDIEAIKKYEADLGLRTTNDESITENIAQFTTITEKINETNFYTVNYVLKPGQGPAFLNCVIVNVANDKELETSEALKAWLTTNGVTNIRVEGGWLKGDNAEGGIVQILFNKGAYLWQATAEPLSSTQSRRIANYGLKMLQQVQDSRAELCSPATIIR